MTSMLKVRKPGLPRVPKMTIDGVLADDQKFLVLEEKRCEEDEADRQKSCKLVVMVLERKNVATKPISNIRFSMSMSSQHSSTRCNSARKRECEVEASRWQSFEWATDEMSKVRRWSEQELCVLLITIKLHGVASPFDQTTNCAHRFRLHSIMLSSQSCCPHSRLPSL